MQRKTISIAAALAMITTCAPPLAASRACLQHGNKHDVEA